MHKGCLLTQLHNYTVLNDSAGGHSSDAGAHAAAAPSTQPRARAAQTFPPPREYDKSGDVLDEEETDVETAGFVSEDEDTEEEGGEETQEERSDGSGFISEDEETEEERDDDPNGE